MNGAQGPMAVPFSPLPAPETDSRVPAQVDVAFDVVRWGNTIQNPHTAHTVGRDLTPKEKSVYEAALEVLRLYLTGEMTFAEPRQRETVEEPNENVKKRVTFTKSN